MRGLVDTIGGLAEAIAAVNGAGYGHSGGILSSLVGYGSLARTLEQTALPLASPLFAPARRWPPSWARLCFWGCPEFKPTASTC